MLDLSKLTVLSGPFKLFNGSFSIEFLKPPEDLDATVLFRATYHGGHPLNQLGKSHPQAPPLHLHFDQTETFYVERGRVGVTLGYEARDRVFTPADGRHAITPGLPHCFWPVAASSSSSSSSPGSSTSTSTSSSDRGEDDAVIVVWAHPRDVPEDMDEVFFEHLLRTLSDAHEAGRRPDGLQMMLMMHATASALVMFPTAWFLGPLRWWVPWKLQAGMAAIARLMGYKPLVAKYLKDA